MSAIALRDRDAIVTGEGLIFRVLGYSHPENAYFADLEYAPASIFRSSNPKAFRNRRELEYYKFFENEGWDFLEQEYPKYLVLHEMLQRKTMGVARPDITRIRKPEHRLQTLLDRKPQDPLDRTTQSVIDIITSQTTLERNDFGVFGSMLHGFHHPDFSDIDLTVYGSQKTDELRKYLQEAFCDPSSFLTNEFQSDEALRGKRWRFKNMTHHEYVCHQRKKLIYGIFGDSLSGRKIKTEFEPVRDWKEIKNDYDPARRIVPHGWIKLEARITDDTESGFMPSIYGIEPLKVINGPKQGIEADTILAFMEEFRLQANKDDIVQVEGNLEQVIDAKNSQYQVTLTYCREYYDQVLKKVTGNP